MRCWRANEGDLARAAQMIREFLELGPASTYRYMTSGILDTSAVLAAASGEWQRAARLLGASATATETSDQSFVLFDGIVDALVSRVQEHFAPRSSIDSMRKAE